MPDKKRILVASLNWGLGHAARSIPVIDALENHGYEPIIASDGTALALMKKEFPHLTALELPGYPDALQPLPKAGLIAIPRLFGAALREHKAVKELVKAFNIQGIISDNRPGVYCTGLPSAFITHRLNVPPGATGWMAAALYHNLIRKHSECWVPDTEAAPNLSGKLGHWEGSTLTTRYIGPLSRFHKKPLRKRYDLLVILSGTEQQRTLLEHKLRSSLSGYRGQVVFVCGKIEEKEKITHEGNIEFYNFMNTALLEKTFNESETVLCRSGYTTVMDLAILGKKAFFIPTPGNHEQEYLAKKFKKAGVAPFAFQDDFRCEDLEKVNLYKGMKHLNSDEVKWKDLFRLFESK